MAKQPGPVHTVPGKALRFLGRGEMCKHRWCVREEDRDPLLVTPGVSADRAQQPAVLAVCRGARTWCCCQKPSLCAGTNGLGSALSGWVCGGCRTPRASLTCGDTTRLDTGPHKRWDTSTSAPPCSLCRDGVRLFMQERGCKISGSCPDTALSVSQGGTAGNCSVQASTHGFVRCDARERDKTLTKPHPFSQGLSSQGVTMQ